jgi:hypothetical protein
MKYPAIWDEYTPSTIMFLLNIGIKTRKKLRVSTEFRIFRDNSLSQRIRSEFHRGMSVDLTKSVFCTLGMVFWRLVM